MASKMGKTKKRKNDKIAINKEDVEEHPEFILPDCSVDSNGPHYMNHITNKTNKHSKKQTTALTKINKISNQNGFGSNENEDSDQWQTCQESWQDISVPLSIYKKKRVWMPFYYDGECAHSLRKVGFKSVYHKKRDFFSLVKDSNFMKTVDVIIDNPPYTGEEIKRQVLTTLESSQKPFAILLPMTVLHSKLLRDVLNTKYIQTIIPRKVLVRKKSSIEDDKNYDKKNGEKKNKEDEEEGGGGEEEEEEEEEISERRQGNAAVPFKYLVWLCYKMNLKSDLYFV